MHFIHRHFQVPSCKVDLTRFHPKPCLQYPHPPLPGAVRAGADHRRGLRRRGARRAAVPGRPAQRPGARCCAAAWRRPPRRCASRRRPALRDLLTTVEEIEERQKMAAAKGDDVDIFACYAEPPLVALNLFHLRNGQIVDRREFFWEDQEEFDEPQFFSSLLKQIYLDQQYIPGEIHVPVEFEDREALEELLSRKARPQGGDPHAAARAEEGAAGPGGDQRQAQLRRALPRAEAVVARDSGGAAGRAQPARRAAPHRVLRHLPHPGHRQSGQHGGVGRRQDEEVRLPQIHHPHRGRQRRFRQHARSGDAALLAAAGGEAADARAWC